MVSFARFATTYLLATSPSSSSRRRRSNNAGRARNSSGGGRGRNAADGVGNRNKHRNKGRNSNNSSKKDATQKEILPPPPPVTLPGGPFPSYYTCRHTYEDALMEEIVRASDSLSASSPSPGLVRVETTKTDMLSSLDPIYALQSMPNCVVATAPSIKQLALKALEALKIDGSSSSEESQLLRAAPRGSLSVHPLVPGMFKGQRDPVLKRRAEKVAEEASLALKKGYKSARKRAKTSSNDSNNEQVNADEDNDDFENNRWVLQLMLLSPEVVVASLTKCSTPLEGSTWPNWSYPAGMANVDIEEVMPSSAYRKLLEAFECLRVLPPQAKSLASSSDIHPVVDLGACPGGWTAALRMLDCKVIAVDRSELVENLMTDEMVEFVKGDAFSYQPPWADNNSVDGITVAAPKDTWMVSDVIAYPERVAELLDSWCGNHWAENMIVTVKFQGADTPWDALDTAIGVATNHGYKCRVKHFFNNKNEVTLMVAEEGEVNSDSGKKRRDDSESFLGKPMYPLTLPL
eukprot:CAMPEP_0195304612 /NCGR_PEP_ID=MMETSP0707-20130614/34785_1 /TAXON_ID=33640 /ORGANISM="Asterionellopsis glacialis, Strain CCMP134" /LENGTH=517 /DNA_ID=CAMNT_0040368477 /DNA_START=133 /DNA_END=1686 /DNA_ORIENTATION=-